MKKPTECKLTFIEELPRKKHRRGRYRCECGTEIETRIDSVETGHTKSCGCWKFRKSGKPDVIPKPKKVVTPALITPYKVGNKLKIYITDSPSDSRHTFGVVQKIREDGKPVVAYEDLSSVGISSLNRFVYQKEVVQIGKFPEHKKRLA